MTAARAKQVAVAVAALVLVAAIAHCSRGSASTSASTAPIVKDSISVWASYEGVLDSRTVRNITSDLGGSATIMEVAPEGAQVKEGDLLVRFDASQLERDLLKTERDHATAKGALSELTDAKQPLEMNDLEMNLIEAKENLEAEEQYLSDTRELAGEDLVAPAEVKAQEQKVDSLRAQVSNLVQKVEVTRDHLHPSQLEQAQAVLESAERELANARQQVSNCIVRAPSAGIVVYKPLYVGREERTIAVGDTVYRNQIFMALPDMTDLVVHLDIPEAELATIRAGQKALITPRAYPELRLQGNVESVGTMAQSKNGYTSEQKIFHVVVGLRESSGELRTGMSVTCQILTFESGDAVLIPRRCVLWDNDAPYCNVVRKGRPEKRPLKLGHGDDLRFVVLEGVQPGDEVAVP